MVSVRLSGQNRHIGQTQESGNDIESACRGFKIISYIHNSSIIIGDARAEVTETRAEHVHEAVLAAEGSVHHDGEKHGHVEENDGGGENYIEEKQQHVLETSKRQNGAKTRTTLRNIHECFEYVYSSYRRKNRAIVMVTCRRMHEGAHKCTLLKTHTRTKVVSLGLSWDNLQNNMLIRFYFKMLIGA